MTACSHRRSSGCNCNYRNHPHQLPCYNSGPHFCSAASLQTAPQAPTFSCRSPTNGRICGESTGHHFRYNRSSLIRHTPRCYLGSAGHSPNRKGSTPTQPLLNKDKRRYSAIDLFTSSTKWSTASLEDARTNLNQHPQERSAPCRSSLRKKTSRLRNLFHHGSYDCKSGLGELSEE